MGLIVLAIRGCKSEFFWPKYSQPGWPSLIWCGRLLEEHGRPSLERRGIWLVGHQTYGCCISFRAELKKIILPIPNNRHLLHETWISCLCQLVYHKSLYYINQPLINYRRHGNNISQLKISNRKYSDRIIERLVLSFYLLIRYLKYIFYPS